MRRYIEPILLNLVAALIYLVAGYIFLGVANSRVMELTLGFTSHNVGVEIAQLEREYRTTLAEDVTRRAGSIREAGQTLWPARRLTFNAVVIEGRYANLVNALKQGRVDVAFLPSQAYILERMSHLSKPGSELGTESTSRAKQNTKKSEFRLIGQLTRGGQSTYFAGFVYRPSEGKHIDSLDELLAGGNHLLLGSEDASTSTRHVPARYLWEKGFDQLVDNAEYLSRTQILKVLRESSTPDGLIGVLSNEDWKRAKDEGITGGLEFIGLTDIPIPYDTVLMNASTWDKLSRAEHQRLLTAMQTWIIPGDDWEVRYSDFIAYVASGIVISSLPSPDATDFLVLLPPVGSDICALRSTLESSDTLRVNLWRFGRDSLKGIGYQLGRKLVAQGLLVRYSEDPRANAFKLIVSIGAPDVKGCHVFPATAREVSWCN